MRLMILALCLIFSFTPLHAASNLSHQFSALYQQKKIFTPREIKELKKYDIILIPGILAESFTAGDERSLLNLHLITRDYFYAQVELLEKKYDLNVRRLTTSSKNVWETQANIYQAVKNARAQKRKLIFISHSLGGLALLEAVIKNPSIQEDIAGIAFLQSPFYGSPIGDLVANPPYKVMNLLKPLLPFINISQETIDYVGVENRTLFMINNEEAISHFVHKVPAFTFTGIADANKSIFKPLIDIMEAGCLRGVKRGCLTEIFFPGPYDKSDGLIPYHSSFIKETDYVIMEDVDHGEFILNIPFQDYEKEHLTTSWLRILLAKIKT